METERVDDSRELMDELKLLWALTEGQMSFTILKFVLKTCAWTRRRLWKDSSNTRLSVSSETRAAVSQADHSILGFPLNNFGADT